MNVNTRTRKRAASTHTHQFQPYPADTRFGVCSCGQAAHMSADASGHVAPVQSENPCVALYGRYTGPAGATCRSCIHLIRAGYRGKSYPKCDLRKITPGAGSDHRAKWEACGRYRDLAADAHEVITTGPVPADAARVRVQASALSEYPGIEAHWVGAIVRRYENGRALVDWNNDTGQYGRRMMRLDHLELVEEGV